MYEVYQEVHTCHLKTENFSTRGALLLKDFGQETFYRKQYAAAQQLCVTSECDNIPLAIIAVSH